MDEETKQQQKQDSAKQSGFGSKTKYQENRWTIAFQLDVYCRKRYAVIVQAKQWAGLGFSSNFYSMLTWDEQSTSPEKGNPLMASNANLYLGIMECYPS